MSMPVTVNIAEKNVNLKDILEVFSYLKKIDQKFSTFKKTSEISKINNGRLKKKDFSPLMKKILSLCEKTKKETNGYFEININGKLDPSGIVKGFAINESAKLLRKKGYKNFYVEIAGDVEVVGKSFEEPWNVGIQNPFDKSKIVKKLEISNKGIATSGNYAKGEHIINPKNKKTADEIASITVIGPNIYEADRFATAAFAMGEKGIEFISFLKGFEGYMIKKDKTAVFTVDFEKYVYNNR